MSRVVIVGGGITGLAAAYRLAQSAPDVAVTLIEREPRLGGKILTERVDGFVIEGGPDTFLSYKPRGLGLCAELGLTGRLHGTNPQLRRTYVARGAALHDLPDGLSGLIPTRFGPLARSPLLSPLGKLRLALDYLLPARAPGADESVAAFVQRRLGREAYDRLIEPLLSGIYAGEGAELSLAATFPQLRQAELSGGSLIRGMLAARRPAPPPKPDGQPWAAFVAPTTGLAELVEALEAHMPQVEILRGQVVTRLTPAGQGYRVQLANGDERSAGALILATPAFVTADLVADLDADLAAALRAIPYASTATVSVAYPLADIPRPLDGYGYLIPRAENRPILACTWTSTKFPQRAPAGFGLLRAFVGRAHQAGALDLGDEALLALVRAEFERTLGITAPPALWRVFRWPRAMPQYTLGHLDRLAVIDQRLRHHPGLSLAGNAYHGVGIPDCIASGETAAAAAVKFLNLRARPAEPAASRQKISGD
jgi:protoporphyrinogen/coproporphyrinogen III oxidase